MSAPLVFVNYHVHNDDLKADRHLVSRHIGKYHRNRSKPSKPLSNGTIGGSIASHPRRRIAPKASPSVEQGEFQAAVSTSLREQPQPNSSIAGHRSLYRLPPLNASSQINPQRLDPFQSTVIPLTAEMEPVFMYYLNTIMPVVEPAPVERAEYQQWIVPLAMSDTALLYALLRCMALDIEQATVTNLGSSSRKFVYPDQFQYKTLATRALNESLANPIQAAKPSTMMAVHFWLWQEIFSGEECIQMDDVQKLLDFRGGFAGMQRKAIEAVMVGSFWHAIRTRTKPKLSIILYQTVIPIENLAEAIMAQYPKVSSIGRGLLHPEMMQYFDAAFRQLLREARWVWICYELIGVHDFAMDEKRSITISRMKVDHRLLSYPFEQMLSASSVQEICRWSLALYSTGHYNVVQPSSKVARCLVGDLKNVLQIADMSLCGKEPRGAVLWALLLGAHMSFGQEERTWFIVALSKVIQISGHQQWAQIESSLQMYYFSNRVYGTSFRAIWAEVRSLRLLLGGWEDKKIAVAVEDDSVL